jgi:peptide/nickel transport system permease protein
VFVMRRAVSGVIVVFAVAALAYGSYRGLRPELFPGQAWIPSTWHDMQRSLLHEDFGKACGWPGCPSIRWMWMRGAAADAWLLGGAIVIGVAAGVLGGIRCARRPRSLLSRFIEGAGMLALCAPVYLVGLTSILVFNPVFGILPVPALFNADGNAYAAPWVDPWGWLQTLLIPWLVAAAPIAGYTLRGTVSMLVEELGTDHVRTARAKGLTAGAVMRHHAAPPTYPSTASLVWASRR